MQESLDRLNDLIAALKNPSTYPHPTQVIKVITTAVSHVFLTGKYAYKINKPLNLGFLDFSTLEKRQQQCHQEFAHNALLSPELYCGTAAITRDKIGKITIDGDGEIIEHAVRMKQMDPDSTLYHLLQQHKITEKQITALAEKIFQFHRIAPQDDEIIRFGSRQSIQFNWDENFSQTEKYAPELISDADFNFIQEKINRFITANKTLFERRVLNKKIKHCHGDFHAANVFIDGENISIFDGIVFNKRFPCSDVIAEIAFMAMDLEFHNREDLAAVFINEYCKLSGDKEIHFMLDFYKCYRAYIRAKINCFTTEDKNLSGEEKMKVVENAKQYFKLAKKYAEKIN